MHPARPSKARLGLVHSCFWTMSRSRLPKSLSLTSYAFLLHEAVLSAILGCPNLLRGLEWSTGIKDRLSRFSETVSILHLIDTASSGLRLICHV